MIMEWRSYAVKNHFGESGNDSFINPALARSVVECIIAYRSKPFLMAANTLYRGAGQFRGSPINGHPTHYLIFIIYLSRVLDI
jgi:uncharacterized Fe-S center protein